MTRKQKAIQEIPNDAKGKNKTVVYKDSRGNDDIDIPAESFSITSYSDTYKDLRASMGISQEFVFLNKDGCRLRDESSALGPKTKVIKLQMRIHAKECK
jgi:hypothetical protein